MSFTRSSVLLFFAAGCLAASPFTADAATKRKAARSGQAHAHTHQEHPHVHGPGCGHTPVVHGDHVDYLHQGHLHNTGGSNVYDHRIPVSRTNPATHATATGHVSLNPRTTDERARGWEPIPHGDHTDWLTEDGRLLHAHGNHYDVHGSVQVPGQAAPQMTGAPQAAPTYATGSYSGTGCAPAWNPCCVPCYNPCR